MQFDDFNERDSGAYSFKSVEAEALQLIPILRANWVIALRGVATLTDLDDTSAVPYFLLPSLGGGSTLRGYAILRRYLPAVNPIVDVALSPTGTVTFKNAAVDADVAATPKEYVLEWLRFDNVTGATTSLGMTTGPGAAGTVTAPSNLPQTAGSYIRAEIVAAGGPKSWAAPAHAYFVREANVWRLVGFERVPENNPPSSAVNVITDPEP